MTTTLGEVSVNDVLIRNDRRVVVTEISGTELLILSVTDLATCETDLIFGSPTLVLEAELSQGRVK